MSTTVVNWSPPARVRRDTLLPGVATASGLPLPAAPQAGMVAAKGNYDACNVWAQLPASWGDVWFALVGYSRKVATILAVRQASSLQSPQRAANPAGLDTLSGVLFSVAQTPVTEFSVLAFLPPAAINDRAFFEMHTSGGVVSGNLGSQAERSVVDVAARPDQRWQFTVDPAVVGASTVVQATNPTGGRLFVTSLQFSSSSAVLSALELRSSGPAAPVPLLNARIRHAANSSFAPTNINLVVPPGDRLEYLITSAAATFALSVQGFRE